MMTDRKNQNENKEITDAVATSQQDKLPQLEEKSKPTKTGNKNQQDEDIKVLLRDVKVLKQDFKKLQDRVKRLENENQKCSTPKKDSPLHTDRMHQDGHNESINTPSYATISHEYEGTSYRADESGYSGGDYSFRGIGDKYGDGYMGFD